MLFRSIVLAGAALVAAQPLAVHQHNHNHQERAVVYVTETIYPEATPSTVAALATAASSAPSASASASGDYSGANGITYSPYKVGGCKTQDEINSDVAALSSFDIIRLYATDCNQVGAVMSAKSASQQLFLGIWDMSLIQDSVDAISSAVKATSGGWDNVHTVSVGNELVNGGQATPSQIGGYVSQARLALTSAGWTGPVVSVDTFIAVINNPSLCQYSDYMAVNAHAFFDGNVEAPDAGTWVLEQIQRVSEACGNSKNVYVTESGWPSQGDANGKCVPSSSNQAAAISSIKDTCGDDVILFTAYNDYWKSPGAFNAEQYWGILN